MKHILTGEDAREAFNKIEKANLSKFEQDEFNKKIQQVALEMQLTVKKCELNSLPDFVQTSNSRLYTNELDVPEPSPGKKKKPTAEDNDANQFYKDIYQVTLSGGSSFYVMHNGLGSRMVSDHWTEESINKCAEMSSKLGGKCSMIPSGEPGAFPDHLRAYATQAFAKHGMHFPDPTPPTAEKIEISRQKYESYLTPPQNTQIPIKKALTELRQQEHSVSGLSKLPESEHSEDKERKITPFSTTPKQS